MAPRIQSKQPFEIRLAEQARRLNEEARKLHPGKERDTLLQKANQMQLAADLHGWLTSAGSQPSRS